MLVLSSVSCLPLSLKTGTLRTASGSGPVSHKLTRFLFKSFVGLPMAAHCCNPSIYKAKAGGLPQV